MIFQPGQLLQQRYVLRQSLGHKTGRYTMLADDLQTQKLVVVKLLVFGGDFEWDSLKLFEREAETLKALDHPAIPSYLDFFELDLPHYKGFALVQTYIAAKSLADHLKGGRTFSELEVKELAEALLDILIYLHGRQPPVIHRDIKPSNILLGNRSGNIIGQVYLVDFGSVQTLAVNEGGTITVVGTYGYMPPEQFGDRASPASDLYALGATLIHLVTGKSPADLLENFRIQLSASSNISTDMFQWLKALTEPAFDQRLSSAHDALQVLDEGIHFLSHKNLSPISSSKVLSVGPSISISKKTNNELEIYKTVIVHQNAKCYISTFLIIGFIVLIPILGLQASLILFGFCLVLLSRWNISEDNVPTEQQEGFLHFDASNNSFQFYSRIPRFRAPVSGSGKLTDIHYIYVSEYSKLVGCGGVPYRVNGWHTIIHANDKCPLDWGLREEESIWLANEIQSWLSSAKIYNSNQPLRLVRQ
jgi:serine/threonine protein kinase